MFFGCNYQPRHSEELPKGMTFRGNDPQEIAKQMQAAKIKIYEGDVCTACGMVVNKPLGTARLWKTMMENPSADPNTAK